MDISGVSNNVRYIWRAESQSGLTLISWKLVCSNDMMHCLLDHAIMKCILYHYIEQLLGNINVNNFLVWKSSVPSNQLVSLEMQSSCLWLCINSWILKMYKKYLNSTESLFLSKVKLIILFMFWFWVLIIPTILNQKVDMVTIGLLFLTAFYFD